MRRTVDDALLALREQVKAWQAGAPADIRMFVYPPEWEALMLQRLGPWADECASVGLGLDIVDVAREWLAVIDARNVGPALIKEEEQRGDRVLMSLRRIAEMTVRGVLTRPLPPEGAVARVLTNTSSLATTVSYSAITNSLQESSLVTAPTAICFPGEADDRVLSLLGLRPDTNYRVPRI